MWTSTSRKRSEAELIKSLEREMEDLSKVWSGKEWKGQVLLIDRWKGSLVEGGKRNKYIRVYLSEDGWMF